MHELMAYKTVPAMLKPGIGMLKKFIQLKFETSWLIKQKNPLPWRSGFQSP
jgi:hypothetical protein